MQVRSLFRYFLVAVVVFSLLAAATSASAAEPPPTLSPETGGVIAGAVGDDDFLLFRIGGLFVQRRGEIKTILLPQGEIPGYGAPYEEAFFLPLRRIAEFLGYSVAWEQSNRKVTLQASFPGRLKKTVEVWVGRTTAKVNGVEVPIFSKIALAPVLEAGRVTIPLEFITSHFSWGGGEIKTALKHPSFVILRVRGR